MRHDFSLFLLLDIPDESPEPQVTNNKMEFANMLN